jgi:hypothetical protein
MSGRGRGRGCAAIAVAAMLLVVGPAEAARLDPAGPASRPGPCPLTKVVGERIEDFSARMITCAAERWPVPGGAERAICIADRESGLIPSASSATGLYLGLFQHSARAWGDRFLEWTRPVWELKPNALNGRSNTIVTIRMASAEGWGPWAGVGC